jgi:hypothetical protein
LIGSRISERFCTLYGARRSVIECLPSLMFASRASRIVLVTSIIAGVAFALIIPPHFYFQFDRFAAGLPQQYLTFDPDRYLAGVSQRSGFVIALLTAGKFALGVLVVWLLYGVGCFICSGRSSKPS